MIDLVPVFAYPAQMIFMSIAKTVNCLSDVMLVYQLLSLGSPLESAGAHDNRFTDPGMQLE